MQIPAPGSMKARKGVGACICCMKIVVNPVSEIMNNL